MQLDFRLRALEQILDGHTPAAAQFAEAFHNIRLRPPRLDDLPHWQQLDLAPNPEHVDLLHSGIPTCTSQCNPTNGTTPTPAHHRKSALVCATSAPRNAPGALDHSQEPTPTPGPGLERHGVSRQLPEHSRTPAATRGCAHMASHPPHQTHQRHPPTHLARIPGCGSSPHAASRSTSRSSGPPNG